jgi:hypothetical protein
MQSGFLDALYSYKNPTNSTQKPDKALVAFAMSARLLCFFSIEVVC